MLQAQQSLYLALEETAAMRSDAIKVPPSCHNPARQLSCYLKIFLEKETARYLLVQCFPNCGTGLTT